MSLNLRRLCIRVGLFVSATVVGATAAAADKPANDKPAARPSLVFEPERSLATEGFLFTTVDIPYRVRNTATYPIRIIEIAPKRGAGGGKAEPELLEPGATGRVILHRQITALGVRRNSFRVRTDDPSQKDYPVRPYVFGMSAYTPDLPSVFFEVVRHGRTTAKRITVSSYETAQLDLKAVIESPQWIEVKGVPREEGESNQDLVLEVRILAGAPVGLLKGDVHLLTTASAQKDLVIPVQARVFDKISVSQMPATFKPAFVGESRTVELEYRSLDGKALELDKVTDTTGALHLTGKACGADCVKVVAEYRTDKPGEFGGTIKAGFRQHNETMDVRWDILVVPKGSTLRDLGTLGDDSDAVDIDGDTGTEESR